MCEIGYEAQRADEQIEAGLRHKAELEEEKLTDTQQLKSEIFEDLQVIIDSSPKGGYSWISETANSIKERLQKLYA